MRAVPIAMIGQAAVTPVQIRPKASGAIATADHAGNVMTVAQAADGSAIESARAKSRDVAIQDEGSRQGRAARTRAAIHRPVKPKRHAVWRTCGRLPAKLPGRRRGVKRPHEPPRSSAGSKPCVRRRVEKPPPALPKSNGVSRKLAGS